MYAIALCIHVLAALFGAGQIVTIVMVASAARRSVLPASGVSTLLRRLLPLAVRALVALFISGVVMDVRAARAYDRSGWFRISVVLLLGLGGLVGAATRALAKQAGKSVEDTSALPRVERLAVGMLVLMGAAAVLMEVKPW